jgi:4-amino-4-deoxy-L-arabinose transferase-like glycosyltransferase
MPFVNTMFGEFLWGRVFGAVQGQKGPLWYYLPVIFLGLFPWFFMLPRGLKFLWSNRVKPEWQYVLIILSFNLLFFSFTGTKLPNYLALCFPFMALVIGYVWSEFFKSKKRFVGAQNLALVFLILQTILLGALLYFALTQVYTQATQVLFVELQRLLIVTAAVSALAVLLWLIPQIPMPAIFYVIVASGVIFIVFLLSWFLPAAEKLKTAPAMMQYLKSNMRASDALYVVDVASPSTVFYFDRKINTVSYEQLKNLLHQPQKIYVLYRENDYAQRYQKDRSLHQFHLKTMGPFTAVSNQP